MTDRLSAKWFAPDERTIATAISSSANNLGAGVGFLVGPFLTQVIGLQMFLITEAAFCAILFILILMYFPDAPPIPPSFSAEQGEKVENFQLKNLLMEMWSLCKNISYLLLVNVGGFQAGLFSAWQGLFDFVFVSFSETWIGLLAFFFVTASTIGSIVGGVICDKFLSKRFKLVMITLEILLFGILVIIWLGFPSFIPSPYFHMENWLIAILLTLTGFLYGATYPILYEFGVELTYPVNESVSSGVLTLTMNIYSLISLVAGSYISAQYINGAVAICMGTSMILLFFIRETYKRISLDVKTGNINVQETTKLVS